MKKFQEKTTSEKQPLYTDDDYRRFLDAMRQYTGNREVNGVLASPFEQYLSDLGVIRLGKDQNRCVVRDPAGYNRLNAMNSRRELREYHRDQDFMNQNPEARTAFQERIAKLRAKMRV